jgi:hypothetical protein
MSSANHLAILSGLVANIKSYITDFLSKKQKHVNDQQWLMHSYLVTVVLSGTHVDWSIPGANDIAAALLGLKGSTVRKYRKQDYNDIAIRKREKRSDALERFPISYFPSWPVWKYSYQHLFKYNMCI